MLRRLNNKGNTLGIVLVGICILSILGTLILGVTSTNYNMKLNDKKTEMVFYHTEKAVDEIYAYIGNDVMSMAKTAYSQVLSNSVVDVSGNLKSLNENELKEKFRSEYETRVSDKYKNTELGDILTDWKDNAISEVSGYEFAVLEVNSGTIETKIEHVTDATSGDIIRIDIKDICVECTSNVTKNTVNIVTDFTIKIPDVDLDFSDTKTKPVTSLDDFCTYALIAQGEGASETYTIPTLKIEGSGNKAQVTGNIYLGGNAYVSESLVVGNGATLNCLSNVVYCEKNTVLKDGNIKLNSKVTSSGTHSGNKDSLQYYTNNILTEKGSGGGATLEVSGNCIVKDDLEINAPDSKVNLYGNYFGYGYRRNLTNFDEALSSARDITSEGSVNNNIEHENSSAIIINEKNANLNMVELSKLILAGRAYIDLDEEGGINTSYMTGESLSYKGNQVVYLADDSYLEGLGLSNGMLEDQIPKDGSGKITYESLGLEDVIAKKVSSKVYFYNKEVNPGKQTKYFEDLTVSAEADDIAKFNLLKSKMAELNSTVKLSDDVDFFSVGAIVETENGNITNIKNVADNKIAKEISTSTLLSFKDIYTDIEVRKNHLIPRLHNVDETDTATAGILGESKCTELVTKINKTPLQYYLESDFLNGHDKDIYVKLPDGDSKKEQIKSILGISSFAGNVGYAIVNDESARSTVVIGNGGGEIDLKYGVIVTTRPVVIKQDFTGMIITKDSIQIIGDVDLVANKELSKAMFEINELKDIVNDDFGGGEREPEDKNVVNLNNSLSYENLVEKSNWRKNVK